MTELLYITPGSLTIFGLINDKDRRVRLLMDRELEDSEFLVAHPCINTVSVKVKTQDIMKIFLPSLHRDAIFVTLRGED